MCIMCGFTACNAHKGMPGVGQSGSQAAGEEAFVLIRESFEGDPNQYFLKWGVDELARESDEITWSLSLLGLDFDMSEYALSQFEQAAQAAFDAWASVANLTFRQVNGDADIDIVTATENQQSGLAGSTVGLASYSYSTGDNPNNDVAEILASTIYMDLAVTWSPFGGSDTNPDDSSGDLSYFGVVLHEIGHALGLDHIADRSQIMNAFISTNMLGDGDIAGIQALYGVREYGTSDSDMIDLSDLMTGVVIAAGAGNDIVSASQGDDEIFGGLGNDNLSGNEGDDLIIDLFGFDTLSGGDDNDTLIGGVGQITANGQSGNDIVIGGIGNDVIDGGAGNDILRGDPGGSFIFGNDRLTAGTGDDILEGGGGADTFVFQSNGGDNTIASFRISGDSASVTGRDYQVGIDQIDLQNFNLGNFGDVQANLRTENGNAIFEDQNTSLTIIGITADQLTTEDFLL